MPWLWGCSRRAFTFLVVCAVLLSLCNRVTVEGHGRLIDPPSRASMWRFGFNTNADYDDNQGYCGGREQLWNRFKGRCGVCGDPWGPRPRAHERGGRYFDGTPTRQYVEGDVITVVMGITANHRGWVEFRVCPYDWPSPEDVEYDEDGNFVEVSHACLDKHLLELADGSGTRFYLPEPYRVGEYSVQVQLPRGVSCQKCLFQWKWNVANSWGTDPDGQSCVGCGPQEQFYACADIVIEAGEGEAPDYPVDYPDLGPEPAVPPTYLPPARPPARHPPQEPEVPVFPPARPPVVDPWDRPGQGREGYPNTEGSRGEGRGNVPSGRNPATKLPTTTTTSLRTSTTTLTTTTTTAPTTTTSPTTTSTAPPTTTTSTTEIPKEKPRKGKPTWTKGVPSFWKWLLHNHPVKQPPQTAVVVTKPTETSGKPTRSWWQKLMALAEQTHVWGQVTGAELGGMELASTPAPRPTTSPSSPATTALTTTRKSPLTTPVTQAGVSSRFDSASPSSADASSPSSANASWISAEGVLPWWVHSGVRYSGPAFLFHGWQQAGSSQESEKFPEVVAGDKSEVNVVAYTGLLGPDNLDPLSLDTHVISGVHLDKEHAGRGVPAERAEQRQGHDSRKVQPYRSLQILSRLSETLPTASVSENSEGKSRDLFRHDDQGFRAASPDFPAPQNDFISPRQLKKVSSETQETAAKLERFSNELQGPVQNLVPSEDNDLLSLQKNYPFRTKDLICTPVGEWIQYPQMWRWCQFHCRGGYCPATHCICA